MEKMLRLLLLFWVTATWQVWAFDDDFHLKLLPVTPEIDAASAKALQGCEPPQQGQVVGAINKNNVYTLTGNVFHNGHTYSIIDDDADVIICEWQQTAWKPVSVVNVSTDWTFPKGYRGEAVSRPETQAVPFWTLNLQDHYCLVVASYLAKSKQNFCVILFNATCTQILSSATSYGYTIPQVRDDYLITGDMSANKAEFAATYYSQIQNNTFVKLKSWEENSDYRDPDKPVEYNVTSNGKNYDFREDADGDAYLFSDNVKLKVTWKEPDADSDSDLAYIFEKLTGLPWELYPEYYRFKGVKTDKNSEPTWKVEVTGDDPALVKLLSNK